MLFKLLKQLPSILASFPRIIVSKTFQNSQSGCTGGIKGWFMQGFTHMGVVKFAVEILENSKFLCWNCLSHPHVSNTHCVNDLKVSNYFLKFELFKKTMLFSQITKLKNLNIWKNGKNKLSKFFKKFKSVQVRYLSFYRDHQPAVVNIYWKM